MAVTVSIVFGLISMTCPMYQWIWIYSGSVSSGILALTLVRYWVAKEARKNTVPLTSYVLPLEKEFGVPVRVIDTQKMRAFVHGEAAYLSVGLLEHLNWDEVRAVVAHEVYHLKHSPDKLISSLLALTSLTFKPYDDEHLADKYAAKVAGEDNLARALEKLEIAGNVQRIKDIFKSN
ncbi:MAG TPA: M48 family metalloprotease [Candidatus Acidoferrales bacterium]|nr:M48 family metalloprotease [Candidatus Acidoferrales bacterium]